jgi:hypothetical protein
MKTNILEYLITGFFLGAAILAAISLINPLFNDSWLLTGTLFLILPAISTVILYHIIHGAVRILFHGSSGEQSRRRIGAISNGLLYGFAAAAISVIFALLHGGSGNHVSFLIVLPLICFCIGFGTGFFLREFVRRKIKQGMILFLSVSASIVLLLISAFYPRMALQQSPTKLVVIGVDGASWEVIDPLRDQGELPIIDNLLREGTRGTLTSIYPMLSPRIWATIDTGKLPAKHGVTDFYTATLHDLRVPALWEILLEREWKVGLFEWLIAWPPYEINGYWIPGWLARSTDCYPDDLEFLKEIKFKKKGRTPLGPADTVRLALQGIRRGLRLSTLAQSLALLGKEKFFKKPFLDYYWPNKKIGLLMERDVAAYLLYREHPDAAFIYFQTIDSISHNYWKYYQPDSFTDITDAELRRYGGVIPNAYMLADRILGELLGTIRGEPTVFLVSDHGFQPYTNIWGEKYWFKLNMKHIVDLLDFSCKVRVFSATGIYLRTECDDISDTNNGGSLEELAKALLQFRLAASREPLFRIIYHHELDNEEDFIRLEYNESVRAKMNENLKTAVSEIRIDYKGDTFPLENLISIYNPVSGAHHENGVFIAKGKNVKQGHILEKASVVDIAPTLLATLGLPIEKEMDGTVLEDLFIRPVPLEWIPAYPAPERKLPPEIIDDGSTEEEISSRLKSLGYIQ